MARARGEEVILFSFYFCLFFSLFSINTLGLFDPLVIFARIVNGVIAPLPRYYIWFFVLFIIIIGLHSVSKRLWCFYVCPLGAVFDGCRMIRKKRAQQPVASSVNTMRRTVLKTLLGERRRWLRIALYTIFICTEGSHSTTRRAS